MGTAWDVANAAARAASVELRPLRTLEDADAILRVMIATWGEHQLLPREMIVALADCGNVPYGARDGGELVGYVLGWVGVDPEDGLHVHSHMLAALPEHRYRGIGYALKLAQRAQALDQGIHVARWTFDPLLARNAWFNLSKLGAVADRFRRDFYGEMSDSLNRGERTDRLVVRWSLDREPGPRDVQPSAVIEVPGDYEHLREASAADAQRWRDRVADTIEKQLAQGCVAAGFDRQLSAYLFTEGDAVR